MNKNWCYKIKYNIKLIYYNKHIMKLSNFQKDSIDSNIDTNNKKHTE